MFWYSYVLFSTRFLLTTTLDAMHYVRIISNPIFYVRLNPLGEGIVGSCPTSALQFRLRMRRLCSMPAGTYVPWCFLSMSVWAGNARPTESRRLVCKTVFFFLATSSCGLPSSI
jgi:hypothetical protein